MILCDLVLILLSTNLIYFVLYHTECSALSNDCLADKDYSLLVNLLNFLLARNERHLIPCLAGVRAPAGNARGATTSPCHRAQLKPTQR